MTFFSHAHIFSFWCFVASCIFKISDTEMCQELLLWKIKPEEVQLLKLSQLAMDRAVGEIAWRVIKPDIRLLISLMITFP